MSTTSWPLYLQAALAMLVLTHSLIAFASALPTRFKPRVQFNFGAGAPSTIALNPVLLYIFLCLALPFCFPFHSLLKQLSSFRSLLLELQSVLS
jgi:hypothetical protein